jgi:hypothetical protein
VTGVSLFLKLSLLSNLTMHDLMATFRSWTTECTNFPREVAEAALAHVVGDKVEDRRGDLFEKRGLKARSGILLLLNQHR